MTRRLLTLATWWCAVSATVAAAMAIGAVRNARRWPTDWDGEAYCAEPSCIRPATHHRWVGMDGDLPVCELVCCDHATVGVGRV
jgi:hypothetical protein